jgi:hypothetical protein
MTDKQLERRVVPMELRLERRAEGEVPHLIGHAAVFNRVSVDLGGWVGGSRGRTRGPSSSRRTRSA